MARTSLLLAIGLGFWALALLSLVYASGRERPEERSQMTERIPGDTVQPPVSCAPPAGWTARPVQPGETLGSIALEAEISVRELTAANCQISDPDRIAVGQEVYVPPASAGTAQPTPTSSPRPYLVEVDWPVRIETMRSSTIRLSLITGTEGLVPTAEIEGDTGPASTPLPGGTLEAPGASGAEFEAYAVARLEGTSFHIEPASPELQSLAEPRLSWTWSIQSEEPGPQTMDGYIEIEWRPAGGTGPSERGQLWTSHLDIEVVRPSVLSEPVAIVSLVSAILGSGLIVPWLYEVYNKRRTQRRRRDRTHP